MAEAEESENVGRFGLLRPNCMGLTELGNGVYMVFDCVNVFDITGYR